MIPKPKADHHVVSCTVTISDDAGRRALVAFLSAFEGLDMQCCGSDPGAAAGRSGKPESKVPAHDPAALKEMERVTKRLRSLTARVHALGDRQHAETPPDSIGGMETDLIEDAPALPPRRRRVSIDVIEKHLVAKVEGV